MPLYVYACRRCGTRVEKLTRSLTVAIPPVIGNPCPACKATTKFDRCPTAPSIRTDSSASSITDSARSSQRTSQEKAARLNNIKRGLTGDGRTPTNLKQRSAEAWGGAFSSANPNLADAKAEIEDARRR